MNLRNFHVFMLLMKYQIIMKIFQSEEN